MTWIRRRVLGEREIKEIGSKTSFRYHSSSVKIGRKKGAKSEVRVRWKMTRFKRLCADLRDELVIDFPSDYEGSSFLKAWLRGKPDETWGYKK